MSVPIIYRVFVQPGLRAWVAINDVPLLPSPMTGSFSGRGGINHRLVAGENTVSVRLETTKRWAREEGLDRAEAPEYFVIDFHRPVPDGDGDDVKLELVAELSLPKDWAELEEDERTFPFFIEKSFDPGVPAAPLAYLSATPVTTPCEGTPDLRDAVRAIHEAHASKDRQRILDLCRAKVDDMSRAFPLNSEASVPSQVSELDTVLAELQQFEPLAEDRLHFEARAGGRVVHVCRTDGQRVLRGLGVDDVTYETDLLLTQTAQGWNLM